MTVEQRRKIERRIVSRVVKDALRAGHTLSVNNGGDEFEISKSSSYRDVMDSLMATDEETLILHDDSGAKVGGVFFVYGNDGYDVICDYSSRLEQFLKGAGELSDKLAEIYG